MASSSEQLLANLSWQSWTRATDLHKRLWFTLGVFIVYRLGSYIPLPGIHPGELTAIMSEKTQSGFMGMFNMISGGALGRMSIMALNLMPYISASIIVQLMTAIFPHFIALKKEGESGKRKLSQYTRYGTIILASAEALGIASWLLSLPRLVLDPGLFFYASTIVTIVGSTLFLMWLGEQITSRGVGNGSSMIIYAGIVANLPSKFSQTWELGSVGSMSPMMILVLIAGVLLTIAFIIFMERAYRKVVVQYPRRQGARGQVYSAEQTFMPIKLNVSGVLPPIFAVSVVGFLNMAANSPYVLKVPYLGTGLRIMFTENVLSLTFQAALIIFFAFFYATIVFSPEETAENLRKNGGFVPGFRPGKMTEQYFSYLLTRLTVMGSVYIAAVVLAPAIMNRVFHFDFQLQGTSLLIAVGVSMDFITQVHAYLISHQYDALLRKTPK